MAKRYEYDAFLHEVPGKGGAYVTFPWNIREVFGKGRVKVHAEFDGVPYDGSIVIGVTKAIREQLGKKDGDTLHVVIEER